MWIPPAIALGLLLAFVLWCVIDTMRAAMFWCRKCKTYHYKAGCSPNCYRDFCQRQESRKERRIDALHRK